MNVWAGVDRIVENADDLAGLRLHGVHLLAGRRWRALGRAIPTELIEEERVAAVAALGSAALLSRVRSILDVPIVLHKGPEVAARYPDPALRAFGDVDLIVPDAVGAQRALQQAGFEPVGKERRRAVHHHQVPLQWPGSPLLVEVHESPGWLGWMSPPSTSELVAAAVPTTCGVEGILTLPPCHHALVLVVHAWRDRPLSRLGRLIDIAVLVDECDARQLDALARAWGMQRIWATTRRSIDALLSNGPARSWPLRPGRGTSLPFESGRSSRKSSLTGSAFFGRCLREQRYEALPRPSVAISGRARGNHGWPRRSEQLGPLATPSSRYRNTSGIRANLGESEAKDRGPSPRRSGLAAADQRHAVRRLPGRPPGGRSAAGRGARQQAGGGGAAKADALGGSPRQPDGGVANRRLRRPVG